MESRIVCIGDELLIGQTINTNAGWMGELLFENGIKVRDTICIADTEEAILETLSSIPKQIKLVLITGGLGPTVDDITKKVLCKYFETSLERNEEVLHKIEAFFAHRNRPMLESNKRQADLPKAATILENKIGTASGMWFEKDGIIFVSMPGVPSEMKMLMKQEVLPRLKEYTGLEPNYYKTVLTQGIGESFLVEKIKDWQNSLLEQGLKIAYLPSAGMVRVRVGGVGKPIEELKKQVDEKVQELLRLVPNYVYGFDRQTLPGVVGELLANLNATISTAESCTGGYLAHMITTTPGASRYYKGSIVSYANDIKVGVLQVNEEDIIQHGAVSEPVVIQMAESVRKQLKTDYAISFSGVAGPDGGTEDQPVGCVWMAIATPTKTVAKKLQLGTSRRKNIRSACLAALNILRLELLKALDLHENQVINK